MIKSTQDANQISRDLSLETKQQVMIELAKAQAKMTENDEALRKHETFRHIMDKRMQELENSFTDH